PEVVMRNFVSLVLLAPLCLAACSDSKDPLDGLTAVPSTDGGTDGTDGTGGGATTSDDAGTATEVGPGDPPGTTAARDAPHPAGPPGTSATTTGADPSAGPTSDPSGGPTSDPSSATTTTGDPGDPYEQARQLCVDTINMYRGTLGLPPYQRWTDAEDCSDAEA